MEAKMPYRMTNNQRKAMSDEIESQIQAARIRDADEVTMRNVRRIWYWEGANSISQLCCDSYGGEVILKLKEAENGC